MELKNSAVGNINQESYTIQTCNIYIHVHMFVAVQLTNHYGLHLVCRYMSGLKMLIKLIN